VLTRRFPTLPLLTAVLLGATTAPLKGQADASSRETPVSFPVVFFPPTPPVYGDKIDPRPAGTSRIYFSRRLLAPDGLADFAGEWFYPPLSTRLYSLALNRKLEARIQLYRSRRDTLVNALLDQCIQLHDATPEHRAAALRDFAQLQTPQIVALENEGDELRRDVVRGGLFSSVDWNAQRRWQLDSFSPEKEWANKEAEFQVVRATAYYQDGLTPAQRGLLAELATELETAARRARNEPTARLDSDAMFFSPEQTRLRLPSGLPPALLAQIATYNSRKAELKRDLRALIHQQEKIPAAKRNAAFQSCAEEQWPQLASLETLADGIRGELAGRFEPAPPKRPPAIPSWLVDDIQAYNDDRDTYFGELRQEIRAALALVPRPPRGEDSDQQIQREQDFLNQQAEAKRQATVDFQKQHENRFAALGQRYKAINEALEIIAQSAVDEKTGRRLDVSALLRQHGATVAEFDGFGRAIAIFGNYRLAMLQPGLSPEQRRLLFRHAVAGLAQPLPYGELLPPRTAKYPLPR
jgi:hypothetical protein